MSTTSLRPLAINGTNSGNRSVAHHRLPGQRGFAARGKTATAASTRDHMGASSDAEFREALLEAAPSEATAGHHVAPGVPVVTRLVAGAAIGDTVLQVDNSAGFTVGDEVEISGLGTSERRIILDFGTIVVDKALENNYPTSSTVTRTRGAEVRRELEQLDAVGAAVDPKTRDAIIGGVVGGSVGVAGLVAGLAAGLTKKGKSNDTATLTTTLTSPAAWTTLTSTTRDAVVLLGDGAARQALDVHADAAGGPSAGSAAVLEPGQLPWTWLGISAALVTIVSCVLFCFLRRKAAQGRCRKQARAVEPLSLEESYNGSNPGSLALPQPGLDESRGSAHEDESRLNAGKDEGRGRARKAWDRLFEILDHDGDGRITQQDFARAPVAAIAVASALEGTQPLRTQPPAAVLQHQPSLSSLQPQQQSFGSVGPAPHWRGWPAPGPGQPSAQMPVPAQAGVPRPLPHGAGMPVGPFGAPVGVGHAPRHAGAAASPPHWAGFRN